MPQTWQYPARRSPYESDTFMRVERPRYRPLRCEGTPNPASGRDRLRNVVAAVVLCGLAAAPGCGAGVPATSSPQVTRAASLPADAVKVNADSDPYPPLMHSDEYESPVPVAGGINTAGAEDSPFVTPDGDSMYFFFTPDVRIPPEKQLIDGVTGVYVSHRSGDSWTEAQRVVLRPKALWLWMGQCSSRGRDVVCLCAPGQLSRSRHVDGSTDRRSMGRLAERGEQLNVEYQIGEMHLSADGRTMYFHSDRPGGMGGYDIWTTTHSDEGWTQPVAVEAVNTTESEGWPFLSEDGRELWFTRTYMGTPGVFRSRLGPLGWQAPELVVSPFAGEPTLDRQGNLYFVHHYFRDGQMIEADIFVARRAQH